MDNFSSEEVDPDIADSVDFLVERVDLHFIKFDDLQNESK